MKLIFKDTKDTIIVSNSIFGLNFNEALVHQVIVSYQAASRQGTSSQKSRSEVTGSNKKPWRQKGTGRARSGSVKSPIWRSGGITFASKQRDYSKKINKKMYKGALKNIFSELIRQNRLILFKKFCLETPKTKILSKKLKEMNIRNVLIIDKKLNKNLLLASKNLYKVNVKDIKSIDPVSLIAFDKTIITYKAIKQIEEILK